MITILFKKMKPLIITYHLLLGCHYLFAQNAPSFQSIDSHMYDVIIAPKVIGTGDFNNDNLPDLIIGGPANGSGSLSIITGNGDGTFNTPVSIPVSIDPDQLLVADFNIDGNDDVIILSNFINNFIFYPGDGSLSFGSPVIYNLPTNPAGMLTTDLNNDTYPDLVIGHSPWIITYINNGSGTFTMVSDSMFINQPTANLAAGDFDNDGIIDLVGCDGTNKYSIFLGDGTGNFTVGLLGTILYISGGLVGVTTGDYNMDNILDFAFAEQNSSPGVEKGMIRVLTGLGNLQYAYSDTLEPVYEPEQILSADINNDMITDILVRGKHTDVVSLMIGNGNGTFKNPEHYVVGSESSDVIGGDFNQDNSYDLAVAVFFKLSALVMLNNSFGTFDIPNNNFYFNYRPEEIAMGDFNEDGFSDVAVRFNNYCNGCIDVVFCSGNGTLDTSLHLESGASPISSIAVADFNNDNHLDIAGQINGGTLVLLGNGDGTFNAPVFSTSNGYLIAATDFDDDGNADIILNGLTLLPGNGDGTFDAQVNLATSTDVCYLNDFEITDFDNDSIPDMLILDEGDDYACDGKVLILTGFDGNTYSDSLSYDLTYPSGITTGDYNGDNNQDFMVRYYDPLESNLLLFKGDGAGNFDPPVSIADDGSGPLISADFNNDNYPDVASANLDDNDISLFVGDGTGSFSSPFHFSSGNYVTDIAYADMNMDGWNDIITCNINSFCITILQNDQQIPTYSTPLISTLSQIFQVFPNPLAGQVATVQFLLLKDSYVTLELFDISSRKIKTIAKENYSEGKYSVNFSAESLPKGIYLLQLKTNSKLFSRKLVIQ